MQDRVLDLLRARACHRPGGAAVVSDRGTLDHAGLLERVEAGLTCMAAAGIGADAVVGVTIADEAEHLIATLVLLACGARQIVLASHDAPPLRAALARRVGVTHRLEGAGRPEAAPAAIEGRAVAWPPRSVRSTGDTSAPPPAAPGPEADLDPGLRARLYLKTSGTTGDVNIVAFCADQIAAQAERHADYAGERLLRLASIEHNNSKRHRLYCVFAGGCNVFGPVGADLAGFIARHAVTCLDISRLHAADLAAREPALRLAGVKLRTGGSAVPARLRRTLAERTEASLYVRYAATECGAIAMARPGEHDADSASGRPLPGVEVEIVDAAGRGVPRGAGGRIRLRAPGMATGYFDSPAQTEARFVDGWFFPGDLGVLREDGQLLVQGRADDMIILNGLNIFPAEIERALEEHPAVAEAAAFALPSGVHGQIPVAAVQLHDAASASPAELHAFARQRLGLRTPRRVVVVPLLPRNGQGKVVRAQLQSAFERSLPSRDRA